MNYNLTRYFTRDLLNGSFDYYVVEGDLVRVYYKYTKDWRVSRFSLNELLSQLKEKTRVVEYPIEEFVLFVPAQIL